MKLTQDGKNILEAENYLGEAASGSEKDGV